MPKASSQRRINFENFLKQGHLQVLSTNFLLQFFGFGSVLLVAKFLEPAELAIVKTAQAYGAVLVIVAGAGVTAPILRYCADGLLSPHMHSAMLNRALRTIALTSALTVIAVTLICFGLRIEDERSATTYVLYSLGIPAFAATSLLFVFLQAKQQFGLLARNQSIIKVVSVLVVVLVTAYFGMYGFIVATVVMGYIGLLPLLRATHATGETDATLAFPPDFFRLAVYSVVGMLISTLGQSSDFFLLDVVHADKAEIGRYSLASFFFMAAATVTGSIQSVLTPKFTQLLGGPLEFLAFMRVWVRRMVMGAMGISLCVVALAWASEHWIFGQKYEGFVVYVAILMLKYVIWSSYAIIGAALVGAGIIKSGTWIALVSTCIAFVIGYPLCRYFGPAGAAWTQVLVALISLALIIRIQRVEFHRLFSGGITQP